MSTQEEDGMDKFGVDETHDGEELEKAAAEGCPEEGCGRTVAKHGDVVLCPVHGSAPFEKKKR